MRRLAAASLVALAMAVPAAAQEGADGEWACTRLDGAAVGTLSLAGEAYAYAAADGRSGEGTIAYQPDADVPSFVVLGGVLAGGHRVLGGWLDTSSPDPYLSLIDRLGYRFDCTRIVPPETGGPAAPEAPQ
jgi:hypothetical protein